MFILPRYNDIFGDFTAISLYRESRYNDLIPLLPWHIVISGFHCISAPKSQLEVISSQDFIESLPYLDFPIEV